MPHTYVLIHGSWHDGGAWAQVIENLNAHGHRAIAPTLAGHGKGTDKSLGHAACVEAVLSQIMARDLRDVILLGHSFGGSVIQRIAECVPDRVAKLIFWNAFVLQDGERVLDNVPPEMLGWFDMAPDGGLHLPFPRWHAHFINDADEDTAREVHTQLSSEPPRCFMDEVPLKSFAALDIPKAVIDCLDDVCLPREGEWTWRNMAARLGAHKRVEMPGSHEALFTRPALLAEKILEAAA